MTLVIMAAGMGSRFGGLKQIEPIGQNGEFIIDYSIYDAIQAGFSKVVFIIKEENYEIFRNTIGARIENKINVEYVFQNNDNVPSQFVLPSNRKKPLGTAHAILCCKDVVRENFAIINADDFYGRDAYRVIADFLKNNHNADEYAMVGYQVINTLTENGSVKRGICEEKDGYLTQLIESSIEIKDEKIIAVSLSDQQEIEVSRDAIISMNMFGFKPSLFSYLEEGFEKFLEKNADHLDDCEYLIPAVVFDEIKNKRALVRVLKTDAVWHGVTYKEDKNQVVDAINQLIKKGVYPKNLWQ